MADLQHAQHSDVHDVIDALDRVQPDDGAVFLDGYHDKVADEIYGLALYGVGNGPPDFPAAVLMANMPGVTIPWTGDALRAGLARLKRQK